MKEVLGVNWLKLQNRRVYELLHIFEGLGLIERDLQNRYRYLGTDGVARKFENRSERLPKKPGAAEKKDTKLKEESKLETIFCGTFPLMNML